jgi:hypothetical protein
MITVGIWIVAVSSLVILAMTTFPDGLLVAVIDVTSKLVFMFGLSVVTLGIMLRTLEFMLDLIEGTM